MPVAWDELNRALEKREAAGLIPLRWRARAKGRNGSMRFALLAYRGRSLLKIPLARRRKLLEQAVRMLTGDSVCLSEPLDAPAGDLVRAAREQKPEDIIAKRAGSIYEPGARSGAWVKFRVNQGQELVIGGYVPGRIFFESLLVGYYERGKLIFIGKVKDGFVPRTRKDLFERFKSLETEFCPFANLPEPKNARRGEPLTSEVMKKCRWLETGARDASGVYGNDRIESSAPCAVRRLARRQTRA